jgi:hypothetical protein
MGLEDDAPFDAIISLNTVHIAPWEERSVVQERMAKPIPDCGLSASMSANCQSVVALRPFWVISRHTD